MGETLYRIKAKESIIDKTVFLLQIIALLMFCWRSPFEFLGIHQLVYVVLALIVVLNLLLAQKYKHKSNIPSWLYFLWGIFVFVAFLPEKGLLMSGMGFASIYLIFLIWMLSPITSWRDENYANKFILILVLVMVINAVISIYQYFVDPSVFGIVRSLYADEELLSAGKLSRRTVGFMGSPQSFSASMGVSLFMASSLKNKRLRLLCIGIIMIGGLLSGSRAFGLYLIFFIFFLYNNQNTKNKIVAAFVIIVLLVVAGASISSLFSENETLSRNFTVNNWAAKSIFFSQFYDFTGIDFIFGKGYGLEGWSSQTGSLSFDYSSTESAFLSIVYQTGLIGGLLFILTYIMIYRNSYRTLFCRCLMIPMFINLCVTPAFVGFAYSYMAWCVLFMLNNKKIGSKHE